MHHESPWRYLVEHSCNTSSELGGDHPRALELFVLHVNKVGEITWKFLFSCIMGWRWGWGWVALKLFLNASLAQGDHCMELFFFFFPKPFLFIAHNERERDQVQAFSIMI